SPMKIRCLLIWLSALTLIVGTCVGLLPGFLLWMEPVPKGNERLLIAKVRTSQIHCLAFVSEGVLASGGSDGGVRLWNANDGSEIARYVGADKATTSIAVARQGNLLLGSTIRDVWIWDIDAPTEARTHRWPEVHLEEAMVVTPDGTLVANLDRHGKIVVLDVSTGRLLHTLTPQVGVASVAISPDGQSVLAVSSDKDGMMVMQRWDPRTGKEVRSLHGGRLKEWVTCLGFSPDGTTIAGGSTSGTIRIWSASTADEIRELHGHSALVRCLQFSPDGRRLASGG